MLKLKAKANWKEFSNNAVPGAKWYFWGDLKVCVGDPKAEGHHHISISHPYRYPTWDEIYTARYDLMPANIHPNCFHVHEVMDSEIPAGIIGI